MEQDCGGSKSVMMKIKRNEDHCDGLNTLRCWCQANQEAGPEVGYIRKYVLIEVR